jgi:FtsH-binding integral membrane protein
MRLTWRDGLATLFVAAAVVVYGLWVTGTAMSQVSVRVIAAVVFGLGWAGCVSNQREMAVVYGADRDRRRPPVAYVVLASAVGAVALVAAIIALVAASEAILVTLVAATAALWAMSTVRHALADPADKGRDVSGRPLQRIA